MTWPRLPFIRTELVHRPPHRMPVDPGRSSASSSARPSSRQQRRPDHPGPSSWTAPTPLPVYTKAPEARTSSRDHPPRLAARPASPTRPRHGFAQRIGTDERTRPHTRPNPARTGGVWRPTVRGLCGLGAGRDPAEMGVSASSGHVYEIGTGLVTTSVRRESQKIRSRTYRVAQQDPAARAHQSVHDGTFRGSAL